MNDHQNPGASTANGSTSSIAIRASASASGNDDGRRPTRANSAVVIINTVRTVGNWKPVIAA